MVSSVSSSTSSWIICWIDSILSIIFFIMMGESSFIHTGCLSLSEEPRRYCCRFIRKSILQMTSNSNGHKEHWQYHHDRCDIIPCDIVSCAEMSYHATWWDVIRFGSRWCCILWFVVIWCDVVSFYLVQYEVMSCNVMCNDTIWCDLKSSWCDVMTYDVMW